MSTDDLAVAVVGLAVRLPGADTPGDYWQLLAGGRSAITRRGTGEGDYVPAYGALPGSGMFDPRRYGISDAEALLIDPQQRLLLEVADEALADAGVDPRTRTVSAYAGVGRNDYLAWVASALAGRPGVDDMALEVANGGDYAATRLAYRLGLTGAAMTVQSACSTALVAVHLACQDLLGFGSDVAIAATSAVRVPGPRGYHAPAGGIGSRSGYCRPFDAGADGTVPGDGAGAVVLKRLADARTDGDDIWAVIRGTAVNNDGSVKSGFAGVSSRAQRDVIRAALDVAGLDPADIDYVEAHGSGTRVGDAAEWDALTEVFGGTGRELRVGAVKANLGHLREAAGIAGLVKTILAVRHRRFAPTPTFRSLPGDLARGGGTLVPLPEPQIWAEPTGGVRRAGVSAFGLGGTNCHVVLEDAPPRPEPEPRPEALLLVSSHTAETLDDETAALREAVLADPGRAGALARTTQTGRRVLRERRFVVVSADPAEAFEPHRLRAQTASAGSHDGIGFVLPGIGSHYPGMGAGLAADLPVFAGHLRGVVAIADELTGGKVGPQFHAEGAAPGSERVDLAAMLRRGTRPAADGRDLPQLHLGLFCFEYALARTLQELGLQPAVLIGHSLGEWVSAALADVIDLAAAMSAVHRRAELVKLAGPGAMLAVLAGAGEVAGFAGDDAWLAADNGPRHCVFSGTPDGIARLDTRLREAGHSVLPVDSAHPFHTPQLAEAARLLGDDLEGLDLRRPTIPLASSVLGEWLGDRGSEPGYWRRHMVDTVHFRDAIALALDRVRVLVEVGPGTARPWVLQADPDAVVVRTVRQSYERVSDTETLLTALGELWAHGADLDFTPLHGSRPVKDRLPRPALRRRRFLPDQPPAATPATAPAVPVAAAAPDGDALEQHLRTQWQLLLGLREVHPDDHFFHLGGDSLMGVHLIAGIRELTGRSVPSSAVFASARFGAMVEHVRGWLTGPRDRTTEGTQVNV
ncbi:type I polyketide synthase [Actinoplanes sp. N902-109]|uniref:type I polyketide synthase n=1 Tax=Actinoplanes sp. (strain N902-109) TaxID=649831 RepID=UPI0003295997|nr:type I polyketide synthase [Actinoplanes sp. N902-109]AGL14997.1 polyketide synthase type I [Actinoplanes sp. N902-109]